MTTTTCPCGTREDHEIARRRTSDGKTIMFWSDGLVTRAMGFGIKGIGAARSAYETAKNVEAAWLVADEVELYDVDEVAALVKAARRAVRQNHHDPREFLRATMRGVRYQPIKGGRVYQHARSCVCHTCKEAV